MTHYTQHSPSSRASFLLLCVRVSHVTENHVTSNLKDLESTKHLLHLLPHRCQVYWIIQCTSNPLLSPSSALDHPVHFHIGSSTIDVKCIGSSSALPNLFDRRQVHWIIQCTSTSAYLSMASGPPSDLASQ